MPSSSAICLLSLPRITRPNTCRSRVVSVSNRLRNPRSSARCARATVSCATAARTAASSASRFTGLVRKSTAPAFIARTLVSTSPRPVRKTIGRDSAARPRTACSSTPFMPGRATSSSRQPPDVLVPARNSAADAYPRTSKPAMRSTRASAARSGASSSTMCTSGAATAGVMARTHRGRAAPRPSA